MKALYLLCRHDNDVGYDEYDAFIICAGSPREARQVANANCADEGGVWDNATLVSCRKIGQASRNVKKGRVLGSFCAG